MKIFLSVFLGIFSWSCLGADLNGYTSQYECKSGGTSCNVDVAALGVRACDQTITAAASWSTINWSNNTICLEAGDHTAKGVLTVPAANPGTSGTRKVLRLAGSDTTNPWDLASGSQAKLESLVVKASYWVIHRISFPSASSSSNNTRVVTSGESGTDTVQHVIYNKILVEGGNSTAYYGFSQNLFGIEATYSNLTLQNSVLRGWYGSAAWGSAETEVVAVNVGGNISNTYIVNNEVYDVAGHAFQLGGNSGGSFANIVLENNDFYFSAAALTNGGQTSKGEGFVSIKGSGTSGGPVKIVHNRIWNARRWDSGFCCNGTDGAAVFFGAGGGPVDSNYILFQNNILTDSQIGIEWTHWNPPPSSGNNVSVIGNIFYNIQAFYAANESSAWRIGSGGANTTEHYLNTIISAVKYADGPFDTNTDQRCNVMISAGTSSETNGSGTVWDYNAYYDTTNNGETTKEDKTITLKTAYTGCTTAGCSATENTTGLSVGDIVRTSSTPVTDCTSNVKHCYLYKVTSVGASGSIQAVRGPYSFYKKLLTGAEQVFIPYARAYAGAAEATLCPSTYNSRSGIGIGNGP